MSEEFPLVLTRFGFEWGPMIVERAASDPRFGSPKGRCLHAEVTCSIEPKRRRGSE